MIPLPLLKIATLSLSLFVLVTVALWLRGLLRRDEAGRNRWLVLAGYLALWIAPTVGTLLLWARMPR